MAQKDSVRYLALLRGINVGGNNIIKMTDLKASFERLSFKNVITYIQSGNVIFEAEEKNIEKLTLKIEKELTDSFNYKSKVVVISREQMELVMKELPENFGAEPEIYKYDVIFLKEIVSPGEVLKQIKLREGVDYAASGTHTLYFRRQINKAGQSYLINVIKLPVYKQMTIRNWNTTKTLFEIISS